MRSYPLEQLARARKLAASGEGRRRRLAADVSLSELAAEVGCAHSTVWKWELGLRRPNGQAALNYLAALDRLAALETATA